LIIITINQFIFLQNTQQQKGLPPESPALLFLDAAPQHWSDDSDMVALCEESHVVAIMIPASLTHVFQPCDQYIIAGIRNQFQLGWDEECENIVRNHTNSVAVAELCAKSLKILKPRMYRLLSKAWNNITPAVIMKSWEVTGV